MAAQPLVAPLISLPEKWHARWTHNYGRNKVICRNCNWAEGRQLCRPFAQVAATAKSLSCSLDTPDTPLPPDTPLRLRLCFKVRAGVGDSEFELLDNVWQCLGHLPRTEGDFNLARTYLATPKGERWMQRQSKEQREREWDSEQVRLSKSARKVCYNFA